MVMFYWKKGVKRVMKKSDVLILTKSNEEQHDMIIVIKYFQDEYRKMKINKIKYKGDVGDKLYKFAERMVKEYKKIKQFIK